MKWRVAALLLALVSAACWRKPADPHSDFSAFVDTYFIRYFDFHPTEGTAAGLHEYDTKLENWHASRVAERIAELRSQSEAIAALRNRNLSPDDAIDAEILAGRIQAEILDLDGLRLWRHNPLLYASIPGEAINGLMKRNYAPPKERLRAVIERMRGIPPLLQTMQNNMGDVPREFAELAIRVVRGSDGFFRDSVPMWAREASGGDERLMAELQSVNRPVLTALEVAGQYLERDLLPSANASFAIGADAFARKLEYEELVDIPVPQLLAIGQANLDRDHQAFLDTAAKIDGGRNPAETMRTLSLQHPSEHDLIRSAAATAETIREFVVKKGIVPIPSDVRPSIMPTPPFARAGTFASMDTPGPFEAKAREAFYYITPVESHWPLAHKEEHLRLFNRPVMDMITIHEAWPGHYVQFLYAPGFPTKTRKLTSCGTGAEGWAHYAEQMMLEAGFGANDPKLRLAQLSEALVRDVRFLAGIKLHTHGMSVDEAKELFMREAFMEEANALEEARRGAYNPTYLYYTLGKLQIYKLRADYAKSKGSAYSLGTFHHDLVKQGAIPLRLVRRILLPGDTGSTL